MSLESLLNLEPYVEIIDLGDNGKEKQTPSLFDQKREELEFLMDQIKFKDLRMKKESDTEVINYVFGNNIETTNNGSVNAELSGGSPLIIRFSYNNPLFKRRIEILDESAITFSIDVKSTDDTGKKDCKRASQFDKLDLGIFFSNLVLNDLNRRSGTT